MNVCFFTDMSGLGGGELWVLRARRVLIEHGHEVSIACPYRSAFFHRAQRDAADVHAYFRMTGVPFHEPLYHFLRKRRIDVVYCTVIGAFCEVRALEAILERINAERTDGKAILVVKTGLPPIPSLGPEYYGLGAGALVRRLHVVTPAIKRDFLAWLPEVRDALDAFVHVVPEGIDLARFAPGTVDRAQARERWELDATDHAIVTAARLHPTKGIDNLLLAFAELGRTRPGLHLLVAGEGDDRARLESLARHVVPGGQVRFAGHVGDIRELLAAADVFCHPSLADGMPNAVIEAMAMALPVVASAVGGIPELVTDGVSGRLVPPHDVAALERRLGELLDDPARAATMGAAARRAAERVGDWRTHTLKLAALLEAEWTSFQRSPEIVHAPPAPPPRSPVRVMFLMNALRTGGEETELAILARHVDRSQIALSALSLWASGDAPAIEARLQGDGVEVDTACHARPSLEEKVGYVLHRIRADGIQVVVGCQDTLVAWHVFEHLAPGECRLIEHLGIAGEAYRIPKTHTARCIGVSREIVRHAAALMPDPSRAVWLPSMVDVAAHEGHLRERLRRELGFGDDRVVLFVGRLDPKKGLETLVDAAALLLPRHPSLRFVIAGGADDHHPGYFEALHARATQRCDLARFVFAGHRSDVPRLLAAADLLVLPSHGEGMSHVLHEAGAAGLAVIASDDGASSEQLDAGKAGMLLADVEPATLVDAIERLLLDPAERARLGAALRARVRREYAAQRIVPQWQKLLTDVAADVPAPSIARALRLVPEDRPLPFPLEIQIETNTVCNAHCIMCPYTEVSKELPHGRMDPALYERILDQCAQEKSLWRIEPFLNNEPFTDKRIVEWIALAKRKVPHAMVTVTTNGSLLTPRVADRLIRSGLDAIWFSFNGATRETYEKIMGLSFDTVKGNIDYLLEVKPASLRVFTNMIETVPMQGEIADNIRYWRSRGVESGSSPLVNRAGNVRNFDELNFQPVNPKPVRICELLYHKMYIGYNGDVLLCCMDWRRRVPLGNVREQSLREIWNGERYRHYRRLHEEGRPLELELCRDCSYVHT